MATHILVGNPTAQSGRNAARIHARPGGRELHAQIDGEEAPASPSVRVEVLPRALRLVVPAEHASVAR